METNKKGENYQKIIKGLTKEIRKLENKYPKEMIAGACNRYSKELRIEKRAERDIKEAEERLAILKRKRNKGN